MHVWLTGVVTVLGIGAGVLVAVLLARDVVAGDRTFIVLGVVEAVLLVQAVVGFVSLARTARDVSGITFSAYLIGVLLVLPIGAFWSLAERTRAGTGVLLVAVLTVLAMQLRLVDIWGGLGG